MKNEDLNKINITSPNLLDERLAELKRLFPDLFDGNGNLNEKELKDLLSGYTNSQVEKFTFEWGGKSASKKLAFTPSKATLVPDKERSVNFDDTKNLIIEADNLHALKLLQTSYANKVKCIYIDPPYNTGGDFIYKDNYSEIVMEYWEKNGQVHDGVKLDSNTEKNGRFHSEWLSMMQSRLILARKFLKDDGLIFVSIDDNEVHNLRKLMDEVFGEENFVANIVWERSYSPVNLKLHFSESHEYILCYAKSLLELPEISLERSDEANKRYSNPDNDPRGVWKASDFSVGPANKQNLYEITTPSGRKVLPPKGRSWVVSEEKFNEMVNDNRIWFGETGANVPAQKRFLSEVQRGITPTTLWKYTDVGHTQDARKETKEIFDGNAYFDYPKPVSLIKRIISLSSNDNDIVMDFFAGSGTTGHATIELNKEDGKNRRFILVQIPEYKDETSEAYKDGYKRMTDITIERMKRVGKKVGDESNVIDVGFKVFKQTYSHFPENTWKPDPNKSNEDNQKSFKEYLEKSRIRSLKLFDDFEFESVLYEILLKQGFELTFKIERSDKFKENEVFNARDSEKETLICLDQLLKRETVNELIAHHTKDRFICIENALDTTYKWELNKALGKNLEVIG